MKVLTVIDTLSVSGLGNVASRLAEAFAREGHDSTTLVLYRDIKLTVSDSVNVVTMKLGEKQSRRSQRKAIRDRIAEMTRQKGADFDLILVHGASAIKVMRSYPHSHIYFYIHNTLSLDMTHNYPYLKGKIKKIKAKYLYSGRNVICVSNGVMVDALENIRIKPKSIHVIHNGIDIEAIRRRALEPNPYADEDYIINISRFVPEKRHDILIDAFVESGIDCKLLLVGEGPEQDKYKDYAMRKGVADRVLFLGKRENPLPILKGARFLVHTADYEGFGLVLLEAIAVDTPVISRDCPSGPDEILVGELAKNLVPLDDFGLLVERMRQQFTAKPESLKGYTKQFLFEEIVPKYERLSRQN